MRTPSATCTSHQTAATPPTPPASFVTLFQHALLANKAAVTKLSLSAGFNVRVLVRVATEAESSSMFSNFYLYHLSCPPSTSAIVKRRIVITYLFPWPLPWPLPCLANITISTVYNVSLQRSKVRAVWFCDVFSHEIY
jgi:hypothetical protein